MSLAARANLAAYDALPPLIRRAVAASPWPLSCVELAEVQQRDGDKAALRRLRDLERRFAADYAVNMRRVILR
jgi:hypothetical protein